MNVRRAGAWTLAGALSLGACEEHGAGEITAPQASPIISGVASPSPGDDAIVLVRHLANTTETICTGTLVAPNLIVTARHCVSYTTDGTYQCSLTGDLIAGPDGGGHVGADVPAAAVEVHTGERASSAPAALGQQILSTLSLTSCIDDLAFVVLDQALAVPVAGLRIGKQTRVGEAVTLAGYGMQEDGIFDWHTHPRKKLPGQLIAAVGPDAAKGTVPVSIPRTFEIRGASVCDGDSGGPALSEKTGAVVGVYSNRASFDCSSPESSHTYTNLSTFGWLATQAFAAAGAQPVREPPGLAMGEVCQQAADCEHGDCAAGSDGTARCTVACGAVAPCPTGYSCLAGADAGGKFCMPNTAPNCTCGSPHCSPCDGGNVAPTASSAGGCAMVGVSGDSRLVRAACLAALLATAAASRQSKKRITCRPARSRRP
ncbi:MAG TPA: trypsin-like serine protease, partial [Polyangiaceae bacterium]|nr:trypsin-like serine protease [Polyangiaceae bacterium]